jgi:predicted PurR-regulated permease PerM
MVQNLQRLSPLGYDVSELYGRKISAMVSSLIKGVFLIAIMQGAAMGIFYWLSGLPYVFMFTILSMLLAMIPLVGISWLVVALAIVSFLTGNQIQGLIVLGGFYGVVNWIDVLLRPRLLSEGLFYGPVIMLLLVTTIQIYAEQYAEEDGVRLATAIGSLVPSAEDEESG